MSEAAFIQTGSQLEPVQMSINLKRKKQTVVKPYALIVFGYKNERTSEAQPLGWVSK